VRCPPIPINRTYDGYLGLSAVQPFMYRSANDQCRSHTTWCRSQRIAGECPANGGMTTQGVRSVGSIADRGNGDAMGVAVDCDGG
jgi:hypothetical protein